MRFSVALPIVVILKQTDERYAEKMSLAWTGRSNSSLSDSDKGYRHLGRFRRAHHLIDHGGGSSADRVQGVVNRDSTV